MSLDRTIRIRCPAKVNLHLEVLGRRPDGYHEVDTVLVAIGLFDTLTVEPASSGVTLEVDGADLPGGEGNLVVRAARASSKPWARGGAWPSGS